MLVGIEEIKLNRNNKFIILLMLGILFTGLGTEVVQSRHLSKNAFRSASQEIPLLLNSGIVKSNEAEVSVILWFEHGNIPADVIKNRPLPDWTWDIKQLETENGQEAVTISGHSNLNINKERNLYTWYTNIAQELTKIGGRAYLDERVSQQLDISAFLSKINAQPAQWDLSGNMLSIAAYQNSLNTYVMAGKDRINIQLLSRGRNADGHTVLAIPALLEEF